MIDVDLDGKHFQEMHVDGGVIEVVETAFVISLKNPWCGDLPRQQIKHACDSILRTSAPTRTVGVRIGSCFRHRLKTLQMQDLLSTDNHGGDSERAHLVAVALGDVHPAQRLRSKTAAAQPLDGLPLGFPGWTISRRPHPVFACYRFPTLASQPGPWPRRS
jgi:hypothetical protein